MFGRRLTAIREHRGLTQAELAAAIGKSEQTIRAWENIICPQMPLSDLKQCGRALRCSVRELLGLIYDPISPARQNAGRVGKQSDIEMIRHG
jgi:transcriptional regulator with XRE-family HTH domain